MHAIRLALLCCTLPLLADPARAAESYDNCAGFIDAVPAVIGTQGVWCLRKDLATAIGSGSAITINTNNVTLDCNHFKLGGLAAGPGAQTHGVYAGNRLNVTVRNCNLRGFLRGVSTSGGSGHLVEHSRFEGNTHAGVHVQSDLSIVRHNIVLDTGGSNIYSAEAVGILVEGDNDHVVDNIVTGVEPASSIGTAFGISMLTSNNGTIGRNSVGGLSGSTAGAVVGIYSQFFTIVHDNTLHGVSSNAEGIGIRCNGGVGMARDNTIANFVTPILSCQISGNFHYTYF